MSAFPSLRFGLMVGIGGGIPREGFDIRLGDIVVSKPTGIHGGVIQYDLGKATTGGNFERRGMLNQPPTILLTALSKLRAKHQMEDNRVSEFINEMINKFPRMRMEYTRPDSTDELYSTASPDEEAQTIPRPKRSNDDPVIHYGLIASGNSLITDSQLRDRLGRELGALSVEMEAAGLMNNFPCLVIRGICDYADSHKHDEWQKYAAAVAAAYAKELLLSTPVVDTARMEPMDDVSDSPFHVPLDLSFVPAIEGFVGRHEELEDLWRSLRPSTPERKVAILHGLPGIGKTQLAVRFTRVHKQDFSAIFWLNGNGQDSLLRSLSSVLTKLPGHGEIAAPRNETEVAERASQVLDWLGAPGNTDWLLIFDDVGEELLVDGGLRGFFPPADHGSILITSRLRPWAELGASYPVQTLESKTAIELLLRCSDLQAQNSRVNTGNNSDIHALADRLDGLPLAIVMAGSFIQETGISFKEYLEYYDQSWYDLQSHSGQGRSSYYANGNILHAFMITYKEVQRRSSNAAQLLLLLAYFDNQDIWYDLLKHGPSIPNAPAWVIEVLADGLAFRIAMKTLIKFSLVETKLLKGSYSIHLVLKEWSLHIADTESANFTTLLELAVICVGNLISSSGTSELQQRLIPHVGSLVRALKCDAPCGTVELWRGLYEFGNLYAFQGMLHKAADLFKRILLSYELSVPDHPDVASVWHTFGNIYLALEKPKEAEVMYQQAVLRFQREACLDVVGISGTLNDLGRAFLQQGKLEAAEEVQRIAREGFRIGPEVFLLQTMTNLGDIYLNQGKFEDAETLYQEALAGYEKQQGSNGSERFVMMNKLGGLYHIQGRHGDAEQTLRQAYAGLKRILGPDNPNTLNALGDIGALFVGIGRVKEGEEVYQQVLSGLANSQAPHQSDTLWIVYNLGYLYHTQGRLQEAEELYLQARSGYEQEIGSESLRALMMTNNLGNLYRDQGKFGDAEDTFKAALEALKNTPAAGYMITLQIASNLGRLYEEQGKLVDAEEMYKLVKTGAESIEGPDYLLILRTVSALAMLYEAQGKFDEAIKVHQQVHAGYERVKGSSDPDTLQIAFYLARMCEMHGKPTEAMDMYLRVLKGCKESTCPSNAVEYVKGYIQGQEELSRAAELAEQTPGRIEGPFRTHLTFLPTLLALRQYPDKLALWQWFLSIIVGFLILRWTRRFSGPH